MYLSQECPLTVICLFDELQRDSESRNHSASSNQMVSGNISKMDSQLVIYDQSSDGFQKEPEGLIISFFLLTGLSNIRQVKQPLNPVGKW